MTTYYAGNMMPTLYGVNLICTHVSRARGARRHRRYQFSQAGAALGRGSATILRPTRQTGQLPGGVSLSIANHQASLPVAYQLYLPKGVGEGPCPSTQGRCAQADQLQDQATDCARTGVLGVSGRPAALMPDSLAVSMSEASIAARLATVSGTTISTTSPSHRMVMQWPQLRPDSSFAAPSKSATRKGMDRDTRKPFFCIVLSGNRKWTIDAEWPDGTIEQNEAFDGRLDAVKWLSSQAEEWLRERSDCHPSE